MHVLSDMLHATEKITAKKGETVEKQQKNQGKMCKEGGGRMQEMAGNP